MSWDDFQASLGGETDESEEVEYEEHPYGKVAPTTAVAFDEVVDIFTTEPSVLDGEPVEQPDGSVGITLRNPQVVKGTLFVNREREARDVEFAREINERGIPTADYRILDTEDWSYEESYDSNGELKSVTARYFGDFPGQPTEEFGEDTVTLFFSGVTARVLAQTFDAHGGQSAYIDENGEHTKGLVEHPTSEAREAADGGLHPRITRWPHLREDIDWEETGGGFIVLMWKADHPDYPDDSDGYWVETRFNDFEGDNIREATPIEATTNREAIDFEAPLAWHDEPIDVSSESAGGDSSGSDSSSSASSDVFTNGDSEESASESAFSESEEKFIEGAVENMEAGETVDDAWPGGFDHIVTKYQERELDDETFDASVEELAAAVNERNETQEASAS